MLRRLAHWLRRAYHWLTHPLAWRVAETPEGNATLAAAHRLAWYHPDLSQGQLIRLAYWGTSDGQWRTSDHG